MTEHGSNGRSRGKWRGWLIRLSLLLSSFLASWTVAELVVRSAGMINVTEIRSGVVQLSPNRVLLYELIPDYSDHNARGFRGPDFTTDPADGTFRILAVGDSLTYGLGVSFDDSYPARLESRLNADASLGASHQTYEVLNLGVPGYSIIQTAEQYAARGRTLGADLVVLLVCMNDWEPYTVEFDVLLATDPKRIPLLSGFYDPAARTLSRSHLFQLLRYQWIRSTEAQEPAMEPVWDGGPLGPARTSVREHYGKTPFYAEHFNRLARLVHEGGSPLWVMLAPLAPAYHDQALYQRSLAELEELTARERIRLLPFPSHPPDGRETMYTSDGMHFSGVGAEMISTVITEALRENTAPP